MSEYGARLRHVAMQPFLLLHTSTVIVISYVINFVSWRLGISYEFSISLCITKDTAYSSLPIPKGTYRVQEHNLKVCLFARYDLA